MKESVGGTGLLIIVIVLILLFSGIMAFTLNRSRAFAVKDELISVIEKAGGFDMNSECDNAGCADDILDELVNILHDKSYRAKGDCNKDMGSDSDLGYETVAYNRDGTIALSNTKAAFCVTRINGHGGKEGGMNSYYYRITVFYALDIPIINQVFNFKEIGETKPLLR